MAKANLYDLTLNIDLKSAELEKRIKETTTKVETFDKKMSNTIGSIKTKWLAGAAAVAGGFKVLEGILKSTQITGDKLEIKIAGIKDVGRTTAQSLASMDFSVSLRDAKKAAEEYAMVLDDLGDRRRSMEIISAKNSAEVSKLKGQLRDTTLSETKRLEISQRIQEIAKEELDLRKQIAEEAIGGLTDKWQTKYKISIDDAQSIRTYIEDYARFDRTQQDALNAAMEAQKKWDVYQQNNSENIAKGLYRVKEYNRLQKDVTKTTALVAPELQKYVKLWRPLNDLTDEQRDEIKAIVTEWYNAQTAIQSYLNTAEKVGNKISAKTINRVQGPTKTTKIAIPTLGQPLNVSNTLAPSNAQSNLEEQQGLQRINEQLDKQAQLADIAANSVMGLTGAFDSLFEGTKGGFKSIVTVALESTRQIITAKFAEAVAGVIAGESKKGLLGLATATIGIGLLTSLWKSKVPSFAVGTDYAPGGLAQVHKDEIINLPRGSQVYTASQSKDMLSGGNGQFQLIKIEGGDLYYAYNYHKKLLSV